MDVGCRAFKQGVWWTANICTDCFTVMSIEEVAPAVGAIRRRRYLASARYALYDLILRWRHGGVLAGVVAGRCVKIGECATNKRTAVFASQGRAAGGAVTKEVTMKRVSLAAAAL